MSETVIADNGVQLPIDSLPQSLEWAHGKLKYIRVQYQPGGFFGGNNITYQQTLTYMWTGKSILTTTIVNGGSFTRLTSISAGTPGWDAVFTPTMKLLTNITDTIASDGTGYTVGDILSVVGGTHTVVAQIEVASTGVGGTITGATLHQAGEYTVLPIPFVPVTGGTGTGATFNLRWTFLSIAVENGGAGYTTDSTFTYEGTFISTPEVLVASVSDDEVVGTLTNISRWEAQV